MPKKQNHSSNKNKKRKGNKNPENSEAKSSNQSNDNSESESAQPEIVVSPAPLSRPKPTPKQQSNKKSSRCSFCLLLFFSLGFISAGFIGYFAYEGKLDEMITNSNYYINSVIENGYQTVLKQYNSLTSQGTVNDEINNEFCTGDDCDVIKENEIEKPIHVISTEKDSNEDSIINEPSNMESEPDKRYKIEEQLLNGVKRKEDPLVNESSFEKKFDLSNEPIIKESNYELPENIADDFFNEELILDEHLALKTDQNTERFQEPEIKID